MDKVFKNFKDAALFAREQAQKNYATYGVQRIGNGWVVLPIQKKLETSCNKSSLQKKEDDLLTGNDIDRAEELLRTERANERARRQYAKEKKRKELKNIRLREKNKRRLRESFIRSPSTSVSDFPRPRNKERAKEVSKNLSEKALKLLGEKKLKEREQDRKWSQKNKINLQNQPKVSNHNEENKYSICKLCQGNGFECPRCGGTGWYN